jgi:putative acetyltransferase
MNALPTVRLRRAKPEDVPEMQQLFKETIAAVCSREYTIDQIRAWLSGAENEERWNRLIDEQYCLVAQLDNMIVGFGSLAGGSYLDFLYVHKDYQGLGLANGIVDMLLDEASRAGVSRVTAHVSKTARGFFRHRGFAEVRENRKTIQGVEMVNYEMAVNL